MTQIKFVFLPIFMGLLAVVARAAANVPTTTAVSAECAAANKQAVEFLKTDRFAEAKAQLTKLISRLGKSPEDRLCKGVSLSNLGSVQQRLGRLDEAERAA